MKSSFYALLCAVALTAGVQSFAADHDHHGGHEACHEDMEKYCGSKKGDPEGMMKCIKENESKFSDACKAQHAKMKGQMDALMAACKGDMETFCKDVPKSDHRAMHECMMKNESKFSDACKAEHAKMAKTHHGGGAH